MGGSAVDTADEAAAAKVDMVSVATDPATSASVENFGDALHAATIITRNVAKYAVDEVAIELGRPFS